MMTEDYEGFSLTLFEAVSEAYKQLELDRRKFPNEEIFIDGQKYAYENMFKLAVEQAEIFGIETEKLSMPKK